MGTLFFPNNKPKILPISPRYSKILYLIYTLAFNAVAIQIQSLPSLTLSPLRNLK